MKIEIRNRCDDFNGYRAARVKSLFNCESGCNFSLAAELPVEETGWKIGMIVGPSGSGKTSLGRALWNGRALYKPGSRWPKDQPVIEAIAPGGSFDAVATALSAVGLGSVPAWLRPYGVLSNGEKFRADLARIICEAPARVVIDEFSSVVDRQIAKFGALAFGKSWRRCGGQAVLLSCHYDVIEWVQPDWVFDTASGRLARGCLQRPGFTLEIRETDGSYWPLFEPHHYLKLPRMIAATYYVATVDGEPVAHVATSPKFDMKTPAMRACRLVVMPEWQGAGIGMRFLNAVCQMQLDGRNRWQRRCRTYFHTSHPGLAAGLRRDPRWRQVSASLCGGDKLRSLKSMFKSHQKNGTTCGAGFGGHFRAVQGFKYIGDCRC